LSAASVCGLHIDQYADERCTAVKNGYLTAAEAAERLKIKKASLYAYVSRGLLRRHRKAGTTESLFDALEVERLAGRSRREPRLPRQPPLFQSAITAIRENTMHFRGHDARELAVTRTYEDVAVLLWADVVTSNTRFIPIAEMVPQLQAVAAHLPAETLPFDRFKAMLPIAAVLDPLRHDLARTSLLALAPRIVVTLLEAMPSVTADAAWPDSAERFDFAARLWLRLGRAGPTPELLDLLNTTLILVADADVSTPTTIAARLGASVRADLYSVLAAAMHCSGGAVQSASSLAVESYLEAMQRNSSISQFVGERLREGEALPGFGHWRLPGGDSRARLILDRLLALPTHAEKVDRLGAFLELQTQRGLPPPNIGFAIAAVAYVAGMIRGSGEMIFALGRSAGWIAHAIEQYDALSEPARPASIYVGRWPGN
jgi:citrate synthase